MLRTCPSCKKEIRVFRVPDIEGGWFMKHNNIDGVKCEMSLYPYPRLTKRAIDPPLADTRTDSKNMFVLPESRTDGTAGN
jgi:hypothetical protein